MDKLKPCPFCGGEAELEYEVDPFGYEVSHFIHCHGCGMTCFINGTTEEDIAAWNRRAE